MNTAIKHADELRVPEEIFWQIQSCHEAAHEMEDWIMKHPYPFEYASEMECKNWFRGLMAAKITTLKGVQTDVACAYLKSSWCWTGRRNGLQFFFPGCQEVYARWLICRAKSYKELVMDIVGTIREV